VSFRRAFQKEWPFLLAFAAVVALIAEFGVHDLWLPADEGVYAHTAQRALEGELPHRDFVYQHPGLLLWLDVLSFKIAGVTLAALRWPAIVANLAEIVLAYLFLRPHGRGLAALGMLWVGMVGMPAIPSPSASVVCMAFCMATLWVAHPPAPWDDRARLVLAGCLLGLAFLCRQLGAAYLACGLLSWVLSTRPTQLSGRSSVVGRLLLLLSALVVLLSIWGRTDPLGNLLFVAGPVLLSLQALGLGRPAPAITYRLVGWVGFGLLLAFLPLLLCYAYLGILGDWVQDAFVASLSQRDVGFASAYRYSDLLVEICLAAPSIRSPLQLLQLTTWLFLLLATPLTAAYALLRRAQGGEVPPIVFCAPFLALTALIVEIEVYLLWALPPVMVAVMAILGQLPSGRQRRWSLVALALCLIAFFNSSVGKPVWSQPRPEFVLTPWGQRPGLVYLGGTADLNIAPPVAAFYSRSIELIQSHVGPGEAIFSFPYHPEWYVLAQRKNPTRYTTPSQAVASVEQLDQLERQVRQGNPKMIVYFRDDPFNTPFTRQLRQRLEQGYRLLKDEGGYEFLLRKDEEDVRGEAGHSRGMSMGVRALYSLYSGE
jgi:hypothetical protein